MKLRPLPILLIGLFAVSIAKLGTALTETDAQLPAGETLFVSKAVAATPAAKPEPEPMKMAKPVKQEVSCELPEEMLQAIRRERELLTEQKAALSLREAEVALASEKMQIERARLDEVKGALEALLARVQAAQTDDVSRLVALYSNMKPKEAATIMNDLDIEVSVMVLGTMPERDAAPILANLNPVRARAISRIILERSKLPGDQRLDNLKL